MSRTSASHTCVLRCLLNTWRTGEAISPGDRPAGGHLIEQRLE